MPRLAAYTAGCALLLLHTTFALQIHPVLGIQSVRASFPLSRLPAPLRGGAGPHLGARRGRSTLIATLVTKGGSDGGGDESIWLVCDCV